MNLCNKKNNFSAGRLNYEKSENQQFMLQGYTTRNFQFFKSDVQK